ncbi:MAG: septation protein SpoVG family protein [Candidatus Riflebacteria bacterium]|nr:septation protein SpoVG family protein [Candidatus Riflebacteria bacterium]
MKITDIRIHLIRQPTSKLRAFASITIDDMLAIHDFRVIAGNRGLFVSVPSKKTQQGDFRDIVVPITSEADHLLCSQILRAYEDELARPENVAGSALP